jgi:hypothetical protein
VLVILQVKQGGDRGYDRLALLAGAVGDIGDEEQ